MSKLGFMVGFGAGYVLGSKAGHERYEQLRRLYDNLMTSPQFKRASGKAKDAVETGYEQARDEGFGERQQGSGEGATGADDRSGLSVAPPPSSN